MKILITILGFLNGSYMLLDGVFVLLNGKYIGPEKPGPWAELFYKINIDVYKLSPLFICFGIAWLIWLYAMLTNQNWAFMLGLIVSIATLWYLPVGTLFSILILVILLSSRAKLQI